jgi:S1-C subfamily serine protease
MDVMVCRVRTVMNKTGVRAALALFGVSLHLAIGASADAESRPWLAVSNDGSREIDVSSLRTDRDGVEYVARHTTLGGQVLLRVQVDCRRQVRRDFREDARGHRPDAFSFDSLVRPVLEESQFVCAWARGDSVAQSNAAAVLRSWNSFGEGQSQRSQEPSQRNTPASPQTTAYGSGFLVSERHVVTNHHVVDGCKNVGVRQGEQFRIAAVAAAHAATDLALLTLDARLGTPMPLRTSAALGEDVMVAGHPLVGLLSSDIVVTSGQVNSLSGLADDPTKFQLSASVHSGSSGGPVLDRMGAVVGVVVSKLDALKLGIATGELPQNVNFAIKPEVLRLFLDSSRVRYQYRTQTKALEGAELAERARQGTVQVLCGK